MDNDLYSTTLRLLDYCRKNEWSGYEPYDALNSSIVASLPILDSHIPRLVLTQFLKRSPVNIRPLLRIPKTQNPKALGLFLSGLVNLRRAGVEVDEGDISYMVERLIALRSQSDKYWCWGYNFPWQNRSFLVPRWAPNLVCTTFAAFGLLDLFQLKKDEALLEMALSAAEYILNELYFVSGDECGFGYPIPECHSQVHNANLLAADLFCRMYAITGQERFLEPALRSVRYTVKQQYPNGRWDYGQARTQKWVDNFHTGFDLSALRSIGRTLGTQEFEANVALGFRFYRQNFFLEGGAVRYYHDRTYPIDTHCFAQSIITLTDLRDLDPANDALAHQVFEWVRKNMWDEKGNYFYYRILRTCTIRTSYMRWTQAWMFLALTSLLAADLQPSQTDSAAVMATRDAC